MAQEEWKMVDGYDGHYAVSSFGCVKSLDRIVTGGNGTRRLRGRVLVQSVDGDYKVVSLCRNGKSRGFLVHRLILTTFKGPCPEGQECRHLDGDPLNNHIDNLTWGTVTENRADTERHGRTARGERNGNSVLTDKERAEIKLLRGVLTITRIAQLYDVNYTTVCSVFK